MRGIYDGYTLIRAGEETKYFAGGNTETGFVGHYREIANENVLERVYIIKGGPGTGKSTLMRRVAKSAEAAGFAVEYYLCGSDSASLDCIVLDGRIAMLDGTSPHVCEMMYPGVSSEIIDVSAYLDIEKLDEQKNIIIAASAMKSAEYASAYRYLSAVSSVELEMMSEGKALFNEQKADGYIGRFIKSIGKPRQEQTLRYRYTHAVAMNGMWYVDTLANCGRIRYTVYDSGSAAVHFMERMKNVLISVGYSLTVGLVPIGGHISGIYIHDFDTSISVGERSDDCRGINMNRFILEGSKGKMRLAAKCREECLSEALSSLGRAKIHHFSLEEIYSSAMNFDLLAEKVSSVTSDILSRLNNRTKQ